MYSPKKKFDKDMIKHEKAFFLSDQEIDRLIKLNRPKEYRFISVPLGDIRRWRNRKLSKIEETDNYLFLTDPNSPNTIMKYRQYCDNPVNLEDNPKRSCETFIRLKEKIEIEGYDPQKSVIVIDQNNCIVNGLHRCCILLNLFGPQLAIPVVQVFCPISFKLQLALSVYEIFLRIKQQWCPGEYHKRKR